MARDEVADRGVTGLPTLLGRPFANRISLLPQREGDAYDIRRESRDGGPGRGDAQEQRHLRLGGHRRYGSGNGREDDAGQKLYTVTRDQFLRQPLADFRIGSVVAAQQFDLDARGQVLLVLL